VGLGQQMRDFDPLRSGRITASEFARSLGLGKLALPAADVDLLSRVYAVRLPISSLLDLFIPPSSIPSLVTSLLVFSALHSSLDSF
jgi:hypothetical protein